MLDTYAYEKNILTTTNELLAIDKFHTIVAVRKKRASAFQIRTDNCAFCNLSLNDSSIAGKLLIFDCGHVFHDTCLSREQQQLQLCTLCHRVSSTKKSASKNRPSEDTDATAEKLKASEKTVKPISGFRTHEIMSRLEQFQSLIYDSSSYDVFEKYLHEFDSKQSSLGLKAMILPSVQTSTYRSRKNKRQSGLLPSSANVVKEIVIDHY
jgi:hypothetical protein